MERFELSELTDVRLDSPTPAVSPGDFLRFETVAAYERLEEIELDWDVEFPE